MQKFVNEYDNIVAHFHSKVFDEDFVCVTSKRDLKKVTPLGFHAHHVYTRNVFSKFEEVFEGVFQCQFVLTSQFMK